MRQCCVMSPWLFNVYMDGEMLRANGGRLEINQLLFADDTAQVAKSVDGRSQWGTGTRETEVRLDGWCEGGLRQQRNDGGGCATMRKRPERVGSPGTYVIE